MVALACLPAGAAAQSGPRGTVLAYYVPYDATSWASLTQQVAHIDIVGAQWVTIDACGQLSSRDNQTLKQLTRQHGVAVHPSLLTLSAWLNRRLLNDEIIAARAIESIVTYVFEEDYAGFDLDLEGIDPADR